MYAINRCKLLINNEIYDVILVDKKANLLWQ